MAENFDDLFGSVEKSPAYWMQVAILEFLQSLQVVKSAKGAISNRELAERVGVSPPTLSRWLNGSENLTVSTMCRLAAALGAAVHIHVADKSEWGRWRAEKPAGFSAPRAIATQVKPTTVRENNSNVLEWASSIERAQRAANSKETNISVSPEPMVSHG